MITHVIDSECPMAGAVGRCFCRRLRACPLPACKNPPQHKGGARPIAAAMDSSGIVFRCKRAGGCGFFYRHHASERHDGLPVRRVPGPWRGAGDGDQLFGGA